MVSKSASGRVLTVKYVADGGLAYPSDEVYVQIKATKSKEENSFRSGGEYHEPKRSLAAAITIAFVCATSLGPPVPRASVVVHTDPDQDELRLRWRRVSCLKQDPDPRLDEAQRLTVASRDGVLRFR
jgi:hypothetical protein